MKLTDDEFINLCNKDLPIEEMVPIKVHWPDIAYFFENNQHITQTINN